jgi:hypothetical protein
MYSGMHQLDALMRVSVMSLIEPYEETVNVERQFVEAVHASEIQNWRPDWSLVSADGRVPALSI